MPTDLLVCLLYISFYLLFHTFGADPHCGPHPSPQPIPTVVFSHEREGYPDGYFNSQSVVSPFSGNTYCVLHR